MHYEIKWSGLGSKVEDNPALNKMSEVGVGSGIKLAFFLYLLYYHNIHAGSHGEDQNHIQESEDVPFCWQGWEEETWERNAGHIWSDHWYNVVGHAQPCSKDHD